MTVELFLVFPDEATAVAVVRALTGDESIQQITAKDGWYNVPDPPAFEPSGNEPAFEPSGNLPFSASGNEPFDPSGNEPFQPSGNEPFEPSGNEPFEPSGNEPVEFEPSGNEPFEPSGNEPFEPSGNEPFEPSGNEPVEPEPYVRLTGDFYFNIDVLFGTGKHPTEPGYHVNGLWHGPEESLPAAITQFRTFPEHPACVFG
jgi:hypothetical protein